MIKRRSILMLTTQLGYGGAETSFIRLANYLSQSMNVTAALFTSNYGEGQYTHGNEPLHATIELLDQPGQTNRLMRWMHRIHEVRKLKAHHDATISFLSGPNLVNALSGGVRSIVSLRGSRKYDPVASTLQRVLFQYFLDPLIFLYAKRIVPVSPGIANEIGPRFLPKIRTISPFVETTLLQQKLMEPVAEPYAQLKNQPVIVAVGRLSVEKGFQYLIGIFQQVAKEIPGSKLLLVGDGPLMEALHAECDRLELTVNDVKPEISSVIFTGYQKHVLPLMALGRVYALTSATEGFPSVLLEAMAAGLPILAADTPWGARTILQQESAIAYPTKHATQTATGILMPRIDSSDGQSVWIETLVDHLRAPRTVFNSKRVDDFDIAKIGEQWKQLIEEVIHES